MKKSHHIAEMSEQDRATLAKLAQEINEQNQAVLTEFAKKIDERNRLTLTEFAKGLPAQIDFSPIERHVKELKKELQASVDKIMRDIEN